MTDVKQKFFKQKIVLQTESAYTSVIELSTKCAIGMEWVWLWCFKMQLPFQVLCDDVTMKFDWKLLPYNWKAVEAEVTVWTARPFLYIFQLHKCISWIDQHLDCYNRWWIVSVTCRMVWNQGYSGRMVWSQLVNLGFAMLQTTPRGTLSHIFESTYAH